MCGIAGQFNYRREVEADVSMLERMLETIRHRGPDSQGIYISPDQKLNMGARRLSIIDLQTGSQPIHSEDRRKWIVYNGEIYNYRELRSLLERKGHTFYTHSDTEVIVHAYEAWGDDCMLKFNGIFAFALYDEQQSHLLLARDHYGVKPLYYRDDGDRLFFASEMKAILKENLAPVAVDAEALDLYLTFGFVPSPHTLVSGMQKIPPGHRLIVEAGQATLEPYWSSRPETQEMYSEQDYVRILKERMINAIERQMISDVPLGVLLSGGLDSSFVLAVMSKISPGVSSFSVGFEGADRTNELDEAHWAAEHFHADHHEVIVRQSEIENLLPEVIWHLDEPVGSSSSLAMYAVSKLAGDSLKVVLTGQGADEPFAGYFRYYAEKYGQYYRRLPSVLQNRVIPGGVNRMRRNERLKRAARSMSIEDIDHRFVAEYAIFPDPLKARLYNKNVLVSRAAPERVVEYWRQNAAKLDTLSQMTYVDARLSLADDLLLYGDKMSMASSLEARVPFLDLELMEIAEAMPAGMRIRGLHRKYVLRKAMAGWLPPEILRRRKKGFETPLASWFRTHAADFVAAMLTQKGAAVASYFNQAMIASMLQRHIDGQENNFRPLYNLLSFEIWHRVFVDGRLKQ